MAEQLELTNSADLSSSDGTTLIQTAADAALFLAMGPDTGVGARTLATMRRQLVDTVRELARRWGV